MGKLSKKQNNPEELSFIAKRMNEVGFIAFAALGIFFLVALSTYSNVDAAWSMATTIEHTNNAAGMVGALFADLALTFFGYLAYILPGIIFWVGYLLFKTNVFKHNNKMIWYFNIFGLIVALICGCALVDISFNSTHTENIPGPIGGIIGNILASWLLPKFNATGTVLILITFFMIGVSIGTGASWIKIMETVGKATINYMLILKKLFTRKPSIVENSKAVAKPYVHIEPKLSVPKKLSANNQLEIMHLEKSQQSFAKKPSTLPKSQGNGKLPDIQLLELAPPSDPKKHYSKAMLENLSREVEEHLLDFGAEVKVVAVCPGPIITRFEMTLAPGLKVSKISGLAKDLARSLSVTSVRVVEVIPGKAVVGLEIPNKYREIVKLRDVLESSQYQDKEGPLNIALGKDISGIPVVVSLDRMPHLLVAGTTGSGKSVGVNVMLLSLLFKATPADLRLILIDPKMLELSIYDGISHLLTPVVTDMNDAANALRWCVAEMERRYQLMAAVGVRNLVGFNAKVTTAKESGNPIADPLWDPNSGGSAPMLEKLPFIVVIIDEFADMMMVVGKKVEELIARIAQKARAAGIHLILATQRPSVDVITGLIKANVPTRIAFQVSSRIDSRTILDQQGAEQLLGHGDMLYLAPGTGIPTRVHGAFVSDEEVHAVVGSIKRNLTPPEYIDDIANNIQNIPGIDPISDSGEQDPLYDEAVAIVTQTRKASISYLQRRLKIGYNRAARLIEAMESAGVVSEVLSTGAREVLAFDAPRK